MFMPRKPTCRASSAAEAGEEIIISRAGSRSPGSSPTCRPTKRVFGRLKGQIVINGDFDADNEEITRSFEESEIFRRTDEAVVDTHVAICGLLAIAIFRLSCAERSPRQTTLPELVSLWEIFVKQEPARLDLPHSFLDALREDFVELPLTFEHALEGRSLPLLHKDPFDRMLVAQAIVERLTIVTSDATIPRYDVSVIDASSL